MSKRQDTDPRDRDRARRYRKLEIAMWNDEKFLALSAAPPNGQTLWQWLLTGPRTTILPGLVIARDEVMASDLGWPVEGLREAFREVLREGLAKGCPRTGLIVLTRGLLDSSGEPRDTSRPASPNVIRSWARAWDEVPDCDLKDEYLQTLQAFAKALPEGFAKAFQEAFAKALRKPSRKPSRIQDSGTGTGNRSEESYARAIPDAVPVLTPVPAPTPPEQPSPGSDSRRTLVNRTWDRLNAKRAAMATARGWADVRPLHPHDPGRTELAARILEAGERAEADVEHVLAIAFAEADAKGTVRWLVGAMFEKRRWSTALAMQIADAKRTPVAQERTYRLPAPADDRPDFGEWDAVEEKRAILEAAQKRAADVRAAEDARREQEGDPS